MSDESVRTGLMRAEIPDPKWEDLPAETREMVEKSIRDGVSFGLSPRSVRGRRRLTSIHWFPGEPNALAEAIMYRVEEDEMPLYLGEQKFMIRQAPDDETETR